MLAQTTDQQTIERLKNLESGVKKLDIQVSQLDDKVNHVIQISGEVLATTTSGFRKVNDELDYQRDQMQKTIKAMRSNMTTRFQMFLLIFGLIAWTALMYIFLWN